MSTRKGVFGSSAQLPLYYNCSGVLKAKRNTITTRYQQSPAANYFDFEDYVGGDVYEFMYENIWHEMIISSTSATSLSSS